MERRVIIEDSINAYVGREAIVKDVREIAGVKVLWVTTQNDSIGFAIREDQVVDVVEQ